MTHTIVRQTLIGMALSILLLTAGTVMVGAKSPHPPVPEPKPSLDDVMSREQLAELTKIAPASGDNQSAFRAKDFKIVWESARVTPETASAEEMPKSVAGIVLPRPKPKTQQTARGALIETDAERYAYIFEVQDKGDWDTADAEIEQLQDMRLMGHVLYQRYMHPTKYTSSYDELQTWLSHYNDHPNASKLYKLAVARKPADARSPKKPVGRYGVTGRLDFGKRGKPYVSPRKRSYAKRQEVRKLQRDIRNWLKRDRATHSLTHLQKEENERLLDNTEFDILTADIASSYFFNHKFEKAYTLASDAANRAGTDAPIAGWVAGMAAWKLGDYDNSAKYFEIAARSERASEWTASASQFWAARAHLRARNPKKSTQWLKEAAQKPRTFYGLIAARALGIRVKFNWKAPKLTSDHIEALEQNAAGRRAMALLDAQQPHLAELELKHINPGQDVLLREALVAIADKASLPALAMRLGSSYTDPKGRLYDTALFPVAPWEPEGGFEVDRALIYAFIRQESRFNPAVKNRSGAHGLMQLMPRTASYMAGRKQNFRGREKRALLDPMLNIDLGQKYLANLLDNGNVNGDLFRLAVAYNAGPSRLARWERNMGAAAEDPLLFIEKIPVAETRAFVERVLTNYWIYRIRLGQPTPSLDAIASGDWPRYAAFDQDGIRFASLLRVK